MVEPWSGLMLARTVRAGLRLHEAIDARLRKEGVPLTPQSLDVLRCVSARGPANCAHLARVLLVRPQTLGVIIRALTAAGMVARVGERGRRQLCYVTADGEFVLSRGLALLAELEDRHFGGVDDRTRDLVETVLQQASASIEYERRGPFDPWELFC